MLCTTELDLPFNVGNGLDPPDAQAKNLSRSSMLRSAAFLGDLFAVGLISKTKMCDVISKMVKGPRSFLQLRALCLLLSRCVYVTNERLDKVFLLQSGRALSIELKRSLEKTTRKAKSRSSKESVDWAQRWRLVCP